jgi:hypothetical protein
VSTDRTIAKPQVSDEVAEVSGWLDMFPETADSAAATQQVQKVQEAQTSSIPFSEWCVIPVAVFIIIADMLFQFFG